MLRKILLALAVWAAPGVALADDEPQEWSSGPTSDGEMQRRPHHLPQPQVAIGAEIGASGGGGATPGGLRVGGRYLYRLADHDWFDGGVGFTFGSPVGACGRVPPDGMACDHGVADGFAGDLALGVRRHLRGQGAFTPFVRGGAFGRVLRFAADDVSGAALGLEAGAGVAATIRRDLAIVAGAAAFAGRAWLGSGVGSTGQLGMTVSVGAELRLP